MATKKECIKHLQKTMKALQKIEIEDTCNDLALFVYINNTGVQETDIFVGDKATTRVL